MWSTSFAIKSSRHFIATVNAVVRRSRRSEIGSSSIKAILLSLWSLHLKDLLRAESRPTHFVHQIQNCSLDGYNCLECELLAMRWGPIFRRSFNEPRPEITNDSCISLMADSTAVQSLDVSCKFDRVSEASSVRFIWTIQRGNSGRLKIEPITISGKETCTANGKRQEIEFGSRK